MKQLNSILIIVMLTTLAIPCLGSDLIGSDAIEYDHRVEKNLKELEYKYTILKDGAFKLVFNLDDNRSQVVFIESNSENYRNFEVREIW